eukprot:38888_1
MLTTSQSFYKIVNHLIVVQHTKTFHLNCLSQLNNNESADKTAPINKLHYNQPIRTTHSKCKNRVGSVTCIVIISSTKHIIVKITIVDELQSVKIVLIELIVKYAVDSITFGINAILISKTNVDNNVISVPDYGLNFIVISNITGAYLICGTHITNFTTPSSLTTSLHVYSNVTFNESISITRNNNNKNWYSIKIFDTKSYSQIIHHMNKKF